LRLAVRGLLVASLLAPWLCAVGEAAKGKPAEPAAEEAEAEPAEPDPVADAWRTYQEKRRLRHATRPDDAAQRTAERMARLPPRAAVPPAPAAPAAPGRPPQPAAPTAPGQPQGGWLGAGVERFGYVRRAPATPNRVGVVLLLDERARVPGELNLLASLADELVANGWDVWSTALPEVATPTYPRRSRTRYVAPVVDPEAEEAAAAAAEEAAEAAAAAGTPATPPKLVRRRWTTTPPARAAAAPPPSAQAAAAQAAAAPVAPHWQQWRTRSQSRLGQLVGAIQADLGGTALPVVVLGAGLGANVVAEVGQRQGVSALVLLDLVRQPEGLPGNLDGMLGALQAPTLVLNWRRPDVVNAATWLRTADETRVDMRGAPEARVARRLRGWLKRELVD
jgi:hypothetical protein